MGEPLTKFGLLSYEQLYNLGDEIQSLSAKQFLPCVDFFVDRDCGVITIPEVQVTPPPPSPVKYSVPVRRKKGVITKYEKEEVFPKVEEKKLPPIEIKQKSKTPQVEEKKSKQVEERKLYLEEIKDKSVLIPEGQKIKVIMNGWFDGNYSKFPPPPSIVPLFISFHINEVDHSRDSRYDAISGDKRNFKSLATYTEYLKQYEPIGCRDYHTKELLEKEGIKAYYSGCLTMTLQRKTNVKTNKILVVDADIDTPDLFARIIPEEIRSKAVYLSQATMKKLSIAEKFRLAEEHLKELEEASVVITSRLHSTIPSLAFGTPVIMLTEDPEDPRYRGMDKFMTIITPDSKPITSLEEIRKPVHPEFQKAADILRARVTSWLHIPTKIKDGYSIFTSCMDRNDNLEKALPSWLAANPDEIVIVDWHSKTPLKPLVEKYNALDFINTGKRRIKLITVPNVDKWVLTWSFNLAARFTCYSRILKVDCDTVLQPSFFCHHYLDKENVFFAGDWRKARNRNENFVNGVVYLKRQHFFQANGYDEGIITYGWDDSELHDSLEKVKILRLNINLDTLSHLEHDDSLRTANQKLEHGNRLDIEIERNRLLAELNLWNGEFSHFIIKVVNDYEYEAVYVDSVTIDQEVRDKMMAKALKNREYVTGKKAETQK
jgi:hypothetical protein